MRLGPPPEPSPRSPASSGSTSSATRRRSSASRRSSSSASSSPRPGRRSIDGAKYVDPRLTEIIDELAPDVIVEDNVVGVPGARGDRPAVGPDRVVQPGRDQGSGRPAVLVGLPGRRPSRLAGVPRRRSSGPTRDMWAEFDAFCREHGDAGLALRRRSAPTSSHESPWLNLYAYPAEADYARERAARADLAPARLVGPGGGCDLGAARAPARRATAR